MASATLVVTLAGLQISNVQQVVTARGIDRVLVVDTPSGFNSSSGIAAISGANGLRKAKAGSSTELSDEPVSLAFAFAGGDESVSLSAASYKALDSSGFSFINDPGMQSFSNTVVLEAEAMNTMGYGYAANALYYNPNGAMDITTELGGGGSAAEAQSLQEALASVPLYNGASVGGLSFSPAKSFATPPSISVSGGGVADAGLLSDLKGTVKVNLTASEFAELAKAKSDAIAVKLQEPANVSVAGVSIDSELTSAGVPLSSLQIHEGDEGSFADLFTTLVQYEYVPSVDGEGNLIDLAIGNILDTATPLSSVGSTNIDLNPTQLQALFDAGYRAGDFDGFSELGAETIDDDSFGKYRLVDATGDATGSVSLTPQQFRALPEEGVIRGAELVLEGSASEISIVLNQAYSEGAVGQSSFDSISRVVLTDSAPLVLDINTLKELDISEQESSGNQLAAITNADGTAASITVTSGYGAGSFSSNVQALIEAGILDTNFNRIAGTSGTFEGYQNGDLFSLVNQFELGFTFEDWFANPSDQAIAQQLQDAGVSFKLVDEASADSFLYYASEIRNAINSLDGFDYEIHSVINYGGYDTFSGEEFREAFRSLLTNVEGYEAPLSVDQLELIGDIDDYYSDSFSVDAAAANRLIQAGVTSFNGVLAIADDAANLKAFIAAAEADNVDLRSNGFSSISVSGDVSEIDLSPAELDYLLVQNTNGTSASGGQFVNLVGSSEEISAFYDLYADSTSVSPAPFLSEVTVVDQGNKISVTASQLRAINSLRLQGVDFQDNSLIVVDTEENIDALVASLADFDDTADLRYVESFATETYSDSDSLAFQSTELEPYFPEVSVDQFDDIQDYILSRELDAQEALPQGAFRLEDTTENIGLLLRDATDPESTYDLGSLFTIIGGGSDSETIELSYDQFKTLKTVANLSNLSTGHGDEVDAISAFVNLEFVVIGTANEIQDLIGMYQDTFGDFEANISFKISDGGEVRLTADQLDQLDHRIDGAVIVQDSRDGIGAVLDDAIAGNVKSFVLTDDQGDVVDTDGDGSLDGETIRLTVNELANLPAYLDADVVLSDTDENIERRLRADLDYRVSKIEVSGSSKNAEMAVDIRIGQLERLLENGVDVDPSITLKLHGGDTLEVNAIGASALPYGFEGSLVIADDGDALRSLFDSTWNIPAGATNVQLRSLDNTEAGLQLTVAQLSELVSNYPGFSGDISLVDSRLELKNYINGDRANIDSRVTHFAVAEDLGLPLDSEAGRINLSVAQFEALQAVEAEVGVRLFEGSITIEEATAPRIASYIDSRLEFTVSQQGAGGNGELDVVSVVRFQQLVADPTTPSDFNFRVVDTTSNIQGMLDGGNPAETTLLLNRITSLTSTQDAALTLNVSQWEMLNTSSVAVENLIITDVVEEILDPATIDAFVADQRIDSVRIDSPAGLRPAAAELSLANFQKIGKLLPEASIVLTGDADDLLAYIKDEQDERVVGLKPAGPYTLTHDDLDLIIEDERFTNSEYPFTIQSADSSGFVIDAELADEMPEGVSINGNLTVRDTAEEIAGLIDITPGAALDPRITKLETTNTNRLSLSMAQVNNLPAQFDNPIVVADSVEAIVAELTLDANGHSQLDGRIQAFDLLNGSSITLSAEQFESLRDFEAALGYELLSGPLNIRGLATENDLIGNILDRQDARVSVVSSPHLPKLELSFTQLRELGDDYTGDVVLKDYQAGIINAFERAQGGSLDPRVIDVVFRPDPATGSFDLVLTAEQLNFLPESFEGKVILQDTEANVRQFIKEPFEVRPQLTLQLDAKLVNVLTNRNNDEFYFEADGSGSFLTGSGSLIVTGIDDVFFTGTPATIVDTDKNSQTYQQTISNPEYRTPNKGLMFLPETFDSIELRIENEGSTLQLDGLSVNPNGDHNSSNFPDWMTRLDLLGAVMNRAYSSVYEQDMHYMETEGSAQFVNGDKDKITIADGETVQIAAGDVVIDAYWNGSQKTIQRNNFGELKGLFEGDGDLVVTDWYPDEEPWWSPEDPNAAQYASDPWHVRRDVSEITASLDVTVQAKPSFDPDVANIWDHVNESPQPFEGRTPLELSELIGVQSGVATGADSIVLADGLYEASASDAALLDQYITKSTVENQVTSLKLSGTVASGDVVTATIGGLSVSATAAGTSLSAVASDLAAAIGANASFSGVVSAAVSGSEITITADQDKVAFTAVATASTSTVQLAKSDLAVSDYQLLVNGYNGEDISELADNLDVIHVNVGADQTLVASNLPHDGFADLQIAITADVSLSAEDSVSLQDKFVSGSSILGQYDSSGSSYGPFVPANTVSTVTISDYTNQDVRRELWYATSGAQFGVHSGSTASTTAFQVDVEVASDADIVNAKAGTVAINPLLGVDHVMFDTDAHLTLNQSQAEQLQTILRLDDANATPQVTITNYTGADLSGIDDRETQNRVDSITLSGSYDIGDVVEVVINGNSVQVTATTSEISGIYVQLANAINAEAALSGVVFASADALGLDVVALEGGAELDVTAVASNRMAEKQISTITLSGTYDDGDEVSAIINGATITTTASSSDDLTTIATKLTSAINDSGVSGVVDASSSGAVINLMSDVAGSAFTVASAASAIATPQISTLTLSGDAQVGDTLQAVIAGQTVSVQATSANIGNLAAEFVNELNTNSAVSGTIDAEISGNEIVISSETAGAQFAITSTAIASSTLSSLSLSAPSTVNPTDGTSSSPAAVTATPVANVVEGADSQVATSFRANEFHDFAGQADITAVVETAVDFDSTATFSGLTGQLATNTSDIDTIELADTAELTLDEDQAELLKAKLTGVGDLVVENYTDVDLRVDDDASFGDIDVYVETVGTKQVSKLEFTGTGNVGDTVAAVINGQTVSVVATTANISNLASALAGEINGQPGLNGVVDASASGSVVTLSGAFGDAFAVSATAIATSGSSLSLASSGFAQATKSDISVYGSENPFDGFDTGDQINIDGNDVFTLNVDQATNLFDNIRAQSAVGSQLNGEVNVLGYDGRDLTELSQDAAANLDVTFNIDDQSFTASSAFVQNVAAADVINVVNGYALTLTADQASVLAGKLQGDGEVVITDYTTQDVSQIAAGLVVTLELDDANGAINTSDANFVARNASGVLTGQGVDFISIADNTELNLSDYSGVDLGTMITRGSGVTVNLSVDRPAGLLNGTDYSDSEERYLVDISSTANASNGGAGLLADVDSITINEGAELKIDDQSFSAVTSKLASDSGTGVSTGILHIGNIDPNTPLSPIHSQNPGLDVDVTLVPGARVDFTSGAGNLAEVRNIYLPTTSTLELTFGQAVTDRFPPALEENPDSISGSADRYQYEFIKAVPGKQRGTLELDMQDYTSELLGSYFEDGATVATTFSPSQRAELQRVGLDGLLAQQAAGNFTLSLSIPSDVSLELQADDLAYFHEKLTGTGDLTVLNYTGEVINGLSSTSATSSSMENLNSITVEVSAANAAVLTDDKFLPVLAQRSVVGSGLVTPQVDLVLNEAAQFTYLEAATAVTSNLSKYTLSMASGSSFAVQADVVDQFSFSTSAISTDSTIQLVGFDGTETLDSVKATNARLNAVIGQVSTIGASGAVTAGAAESIAITAASTLSGITTLSVAAGSDLSLAAMDLPSGLEFGAIRGELRAPASTLDGYDVLADQVSIAHLGTATGDVIVSGVTATSDLDGISHGLEVVAEVSAAAANASAVKQVDTLTLSGAYVVGDVVSATINGTQISVTADSANVSNMASALASEINSSLATSSIDATLSGDVITLTADNAGVAFDSSASVSASTSTSTGAIAATTTTSNVVAFEFDAAALSTVDEFALTDAGSFTATADELDAKKLSSTVTPSLTVTGYSSEDLSEIATGFDVTVNVTGDATSTAAKLSSADEIEVVSGTALTLTADDANILGDKIDVAGVLNVTDYTTQVLTDGLAASPDIESTNGGQLKIDAVDGATLVTSKLNAPVEITVSGTDVTIDASEADAFGATLTGSGLLSVTGYSDQILSDIQTSAVNVLLQSGTVSTSTASNLGGNVDVITVEGDLTLTAGDAETLGSQLTGSGMLRTSGYTNEDLSSLNVAEQSFTVTQASTAQVSILELSGTFATSSVVTAVVSGNTVSVTAASSDLAAIATQVATAINADAVTDALVSAVVSGTGSTATVALTSETAGAGFDVSITSTTGVVSAATSTANLLVASDSSKLSTATELTIANGGVLELDAVSADELATKLTTAISSTGNGRLDVTSYTGAEDLADLNADFRVLANADAQLLAGKLGSVSAVYDQLQSVQIAAGTSVNATISAAHAALIDEAKLQGDGALSITDYTGQDLRSAASSLAISVEVGGTAAVDATAADLAAADDVVINSGFALNLLAADADTLGSKLSGDGDLNLANFLTADLSDINTSLNVDVSVTAVTGATASLAQLTATSGALTIDSLTVDGALSVDALSATAINSNLTAGINGAGTLIATSYASEDLTGLAGLSGVAVKANADAALVATNFAGIELTTIDVASGSGTATISAIDADAFGSQLIGTGALDVSGYLTENLSDILTSTVNVSAVSGATLIATNFTGVNAISIAGDVDATAADLAALIAQSTAITLGSATSTQSLAVADYIAQDLSSISLDSGSVTVQTSDAAVATLVGTSLTSSTGAQFDVVIGAGDAVASAADAQSVAATVDFSGNTLTVDSYTTEDLSGFDVSGTLDVITSDGAQLTYAKLNDATSITLAGTGTAAASELTAASGNLQSRIDVDQFRFDITDYTGGSLTAISTIDASVKQVDVINLTGSFEADDVVSAVINGVTISATATSSGLTGAADLLAAAINNSSISSAVDASVTSSGLSAATIQLTADTAGVAFTASADSSNRAPIKQVDQFSLTGTYEVGDVLSAVINGTTITTTAQSSGLTGAADALSAAINSSALSGVVDASATISSATAAVINLEAITAGVGFTSTAIATNRTAEQQVDTLTLSGVYEVGDAVSAVINGTTITTTATSSGLSGAATALTAAINADSGLSAIVDASATISSASAAVITLSADAAGTGFGNTSAFTTGLASTAQVDTLTLSGSYDSGDVITSVINGDTITVTAASSSLAAIATQVSTALGAHADVSASVSGSSVLLSAANAGSGFISSVGANNRPNEAQVDTLTLSGVMEADDVLNLTLNGSTLSTTLTGSTLSAGASELAAAINASSFSGIVTATGSTAGVVTLTALNVGTAFTATAEAIDSGSGADTQTLTATTITEAVLDSLQTAVVNTTTANNLADSSQAISFSVVNSNLPAVDAQSVVATTSTANRVAIDSQSAEGSPLTANVIASNVVVTTSTAATANLVAAELSNVESVVLAGSATISALDAITLANLDANDSSLTITDFNGQDLSVIDTTAGSSDVTVITKDGKNPTLLSSELVDVNSIQISDQALVTADELVSILGSTNSTSVVRAEDLLPQQSTFTLTGAYDETDVVNAVINGTTISVTANTTSKSSIASDLAAAINLNSTVSGAVTAVTAGDAITITSDAANVEFSLTASTDSGASRKQVDHFNLSGTYEVDDLIQAVVTVDSVAHTVVATATSSGLTGAATDLVAAINANAAISGVVDAALASGSSATAATISLTADTAGSGFSSSVSAIDRDRIAQQNKITLADSTFEIGDVVSAVINGVTVSVTATTADETAIATALADQIDLSSVSGVVDASASGNVITLDAVTAGVGYTLDADAENYPGKKKISTYEVNSFESGDTVDVVIDSNTVTVSYGSSTDQTAFASAIASAVNADSSVSGIVDASFSGNLVTIASDDYNGTFALGSGSNTSGSGSSGTVTLSNVQSPETSGTNSQSLSLSIERANRSSTSEEAVSLSLVTTNVLADALGTQGASVANSRPYNSNETENAITITGYTGQDISGIDQDLYQTVRINNFTATTSTLTASSLGSDVDILKIETSAANGTGGVVMSAADMATVLSGGANVQGNGSISITDYTNQDISSIADDLALTVTVAAGSTAASTNLFAELGLDSNDSLIINGLLSATGSDLAAIEAGLGTVTSTPLAGTGSLLVGQYLGEDISGYTEVGMTATVSVGGTTTANLTASNLFGTAGVSQIASIDVGSGITASLNADLAATLGTKLITASSSTVGGTLQVSDFVNQDLSSVNDAFTLEVSTSTAAGTLTVSSLATADQITVISGTTANLGSQDATSLTALKLGTGNLVIEAGGTLSLTEQQTVDLVSQFNTAAGTLQISDVTTTQNISAISSGLYVEATLADKVDATTVGTYTLSDGFLNSVDKLVVTGSDSLTVSSSAVLSELDSIQLASSGSVTFLAGAYTNVSSNLSSINGTTGSGESVVVQTASGTNSLNFSPLNDLAGVDSFLVDLSTTGAVGEVRLSEALSSSASTEVRLASSNSTNDKVYFTTDMSNAQAGNPTAGQTWADLGLYAATVTNFEPQQDSMGVVDAAGTAKLTSLSVGAIDASITGSGKLYLDLATSTNTEDIASVRAAIADKVSAIATGAEFGVALLGFDDTNFQFSVDIFQAQWVGAQLGDPTTDPDSLKVLPVASFDNIDSSTSTGIGGLTNFIAASKFVSRTLPSSLS